MNFRLRQSGLKWTDFLRINTVGFIHKHNGSNWEILDILETSQYEVKLTGDTICQMLIKCKLIK